MQMIAQETAPYLFAFGLNITSSALHFSKTPCYRILSHFDSLQPYRKTVSNAPEELIRAKTHKPSFAMRFRRSVSSLRVCVPLFPNFSSCTMNRSYRCLYTSPSNGRTSCTPFLHSESAQKTWCWQGASMTNELRTLLRGYTVVAANAIVARGTGTKGRKSSP